MGQTRTRRIGLPLLGVISGAAALAAGLAWLAILAPARRIRLASERARARRRFPVLPHFDQRRGEPLDTALEGTFPASDPTAL